MVENKNSDPDKIPIIISDQKAKKLCECGALYVLPLEQHFDSCILKKHYEQHKDRAKYYDPNWIGEVNIGVEKLIIKRVVPVVQDTAAKPGKGIEYIIPELPAKNSDAEQVRMILEHHINEKIIPFVFGEGMNQKNLDIFKESLKKEIKRNLAEVNKDKWLSILYNINISTSIKGSLLFVLRTVFPKLVKEFFKEATEVLKEKDKWIPWEWNVLKNENKKVLFPWERYCHECQAVAGENHLDFCSQEGVFHPFILRK